MRSHGEHYSLRPSFIRFLRAMSREIGRRRGIGRKVLGFAEGRKTAVAASNLW